MAIRASSSSTLALSSQLPASLPQSSLWQTPRSPNFRPPLQHRLRKHSSSLSCCKHEGALIKTHMAACVLQCLLSFHSCPANNLYQSTYKGMPKRSAVLTAFAAADSDQSQSSQEEIDEGTIGCCEGEAQSPPKKPSPEIEPGDVVQAQLQALHDQDFATLFEFASPKNKAHTGPLSRFTEMIQGRAYNVMIGHTGAKVLSTLSVGAGRFQQRILIKGTNDKEAIFSWSLSKQEAEPFQDCWMTDSVHRDQ